MALRSVVALCHCLFSFSRKRLRRGVVSRLVINICLVSNEIYPHRKYDIFGKSSKFLQLVRSNSWFSPNTSILFAIKSKSDSSKYRRRIAESSKCPDWGTQPFLNFEPIFRISSIFDKRSNFTKPKIEENKTSFSCPNRRLTSIRASISVLLLLTTWAKGDRLCSYGKLIK